jgi:maltose alpha-D-glucosyltransferase/alpha-amylase
MGTEEQTPTRAGQIRAGQTTSFGSIRGEGALPPRRTAAEQSNTSIVFGDRLILKLFRRLDTGVNPDFEIGCQLTERTGFTRVPAVTGAFEYAPIGEAPSTLAMMQALVESQGDGWSHATEEVRRFYEAVASRHLPETPLPRTYTEMIGAEPPAEVETVLSSYLAVARKLGQRTGELHLALASDFGNLAFAPEPFGADDLAAINASALGEAQRALQVFRAAAGTAPALPADAASRVSELLAREDRLLERLRAAPVLEFSISKIRVHGDYHLGQVLWAEGDFYILDFEGEPARPIAVRRSKQSALKDVAGMMRSFSYAAVAGLFAYTAARPDAVEHLAPWSEQWETWTTAAFLRGYFGAVDGALFVPAAAAQRDELLQLFVLEKSLYELNYELNNRPDWLRIPLSGILRLLS